MVTDMKVHIRHEVDFLSYLASQDYEVNQLSQSVLQVTRVGELAVFIHQRGTSLFFQMDLGSVNGITNTAFYVDLLCLNTEILPVSVGIDTTEPEDPRLVLVESRESHNLDENELMSVLGALELAADKVTVVLKNRM